MELRSVPHSQLNFNDPAAGCGKGMGLGEGVCKLIQEHFNNEKYPPLFELHVIWYVGFGLAVEIKCNL